jgi:MFS family permease
MTEVRAGFTGRLFRIFRDNFSPLRIRVFRIYLGGQAVSLIGTWLQVAAQAWVVWELSRSETALGVVGMLGGLPILLLGPIAGVWADRLDRRRLLMITQTVAMLLAFTLAVLVQTRLVQLWHVYILAAMLGTVAAVDFPAQQAFLGDLAGIDQVRRAVNLNNVIIQVSRMLGPTAAGIIIARLGTATAFWLNGLSFGAVIFSLLAVGMHHRRMHSDAGSGGFREGLRYMATQPRLQDFFLCVVLITFLVIPIIQILPSMASEVLHGDAQTLGLLMGASGAGSLVGSLILVPLAQSLRRPGAVVSATILWIGSWFAAVSFTRAVGLAMGTIFLGSLGVPIVITMAMGLIQVLAPTEMRARLLALFVMIAFGAQPIAVLLAGLSAETFSTPMAIRINGVLIITGALLLNLLRPAFRRWELPHGAGGSPAAETTAREVDQVTGARPSSDGL